MEAVLSTSDDVLSDIELTKETMSLNGESMCGKENATLELLLAGAVKYVDEDGSFCYVYKHAHKNVLGPMHTTSDSNSTRFMIELLLKYKKLRLYPHGDIIRCPGIVVDLTSARLFHLGINKYVVLYASSKVRDKYLPLIEWYGRNNKEIVV